jgi:Kdo2-lipid IVA lauroyltransferase/acyltransferase
LSFLRKRMKTFRRSLYPFGLKPVEAWARTLSDEACEVWAKRLGRLIYGSLKKSRERALGHLHLALGRTLPSNQIQQIAQEVFQNLVLNFFECVRFSGMEDRQFFEKIEVEGWEHVEAVHRGGQGGIFITGHIGNWELCAAYIAKRGLPMNVVARRIYINALNERLAEMREKMGAKILYRDSSLRAMLRCLQNNEFLGILPDQDVRRIQGIFVDFFGRPAYTPVGPALLAIASGAPIIMARDIRKGNRHRVVGEPPIYADRKAPREEEVRRLVTLYTRRLEEYIREYPAQWVWMHRRWRTQPPSPING